MDSLLGPCGLKRYTFPVINKTGHRDEERSIGNIVNTTVIISGDR